jgi:hypothetical protein
MGVVISILIVNTAGVLFLLALINIRWKLRSRQDGNVHKVEGGKRMTMMQQIILYSNISMLLCGEPF